MRKFVTLAVVLLVAALAAPIWGQAAAPEPWQEAEMVQLALQYARDRLGEIGPQQQAQITEQMRLVMRHMRALGYGEPQIAQTLMQAMREAVHQWNEARVAEDNENGLGDLLRTRLRDQLRTADCDQIPEQLQVRAQDQLRTGRGEPVADPPGGGPGGPGGGGKS